MEHPEHPEHGETSPEDVGIDEKKADSRMPVEEAIRKPSPDAPKPNTGLAKGAKSEASSESNGESDGESDGEADGKDDGQEDTPETSDDEEQKDGGGDVEGVKGTASRSNEGNTREHIPDAKGYNKKRINSNKAKVAGKAQAEENMPDKGDKAAASKPAGGQSTQSGKQEGLSNTDTKHSTQIEEREDSPKKPEGPETSKAKGTVDPNRPQY
ncbi:hypothetical protein MMC30_007793 [Trapelia coarctata]|nr:hypothetical protein [Trapelia coarctata]